MVDVLKIEAAGNDFIFLDGAVELPSKARIQALCDRHFGIGADGLAIMFRVDAKKSRWAFFNNDGSPAAMCGNAARAAAAWALRQNLEFPHTLETEFGPVILNPAPLMSSSLKNQFSARVPYETKPLVSKPVSTNFKAIELPSRPVLIDTGVPHVVVEMKTSVLDQARAMESQSAAGVLSLREIASHFRWVSEAGTMGANVTFFSRLGAQSVQSVTFERGVEGLTLACGTGVLAAAVIASGVLDRKSVRPPSAYRVETLGAWLEVDLMDFPKSLALVGPANIAFSAQLIGLRNSQA